MGVAERRKDTSYGDASGSSRHVCHARTRMGKSSKTRSTMRAVVRGRSRQEGTVCTHVPSREAAVGRLKE